jgi:hypothetical protein
MPYKYIIDTNVNCSFIRHEEPFNILNFAQSGDDRLDHPDFVAHMNFVHDLTCLVIPADIEFKTISNESKRIIREYNQRFGECKGAIVVGDAKSYAKIHQFIEAGRFTNNPVDRKVFRDMDKALEWVGVPSDYKVNYGD